mmetsp:Transcript_86840/g.166091  ORF Transcript_86840/g.166091 Transcript_86840/m.166091 type:complete len:773 (-) Transcript_86840:36-2354(-)
MTDNGSSDPKSKSKAMGTSGRLNTDDPIFRGTWHVQVGGRIWGRVKVSESAGAWLFAMGPDGANLFCKAFTITHGLFTAPGMNPAHLNRQHSRIVDGVLIWDIVEDGVKVASSTWRRFAAPRRKDQPVVEPAVERAPQVPLLPSFDLQGVAQYILGHDVQRVVVLCGAGMSTNAGIPDYRTPGSGLFHKYDNLGLPRPEAMFDLNFFRTNPEPFYNFCSNELFSREAAPTASHYFIRMLYEKGRLLRCYTQNIDNLENAVGIPKSKLVEVHGCVEEAHVIDTNPKVPVSIAELKQALNHGKSGWEELSAKKQGLVKPNIVFYGESLPDRFHDLCHQDLDRCDLLIALGTSLSVFPFRTLVSECQSSVPRVLINREAVATYDVLDFGFRFPLNSADGMNWRDVFHHGDCDQGCRTLATALGWHDELQHLIECKGYMRQLAPFCDKFEAADQSSSEESSPPPFTPKCTHDSPYATLGLDPRATPQQIREAFLQVARTTHPDKGGTEKDFQAVREAYEILMDPTTRAQYDAAVREGKYQHLFEKKPEAPRGQVHSRKKTTRQGTYFMYSAMVSWKGFFIDTVNTRSLDEALRWYTVIVNMRMQAQRRVQEQGSKVMLTQEELDNAYKVEPSLSIWIGSYVHVGSQKVYAPRVTNLQQALTLFEKFHEIHQRKDWTGATRLKQLAKVKKEYVQIKVAAEIERKRREENGQQLKQYGKSTGSGRVTRGYARGLPIGSTGYTHSSIVRNERLKRQAVCKRPAGPPPAVERGQKRLRFN